MDAPAALAAVGQQDGERTGRGAPGVRSDTVARPRGSRSAAAAAHARPDAPQPAPDRRLPAGVVDDAAAIVEAALSERERAILDFERTWWQRGGAKEQAIRDTFGLTPTRYYQTLNSVLMLPSAMRYDAMLVGRLLRIRGAAARGRRALD